MEFTPLHDGEVRIFLTRHGKTIFNEAHKVQGWCDAPLTQAGEAAALALGRGLANRGVRFVSAWSGELGRQRRTAQLILEAMGQPELPLEIENGLREVSFGRWEGEPEPLRDAALAAYLGLAPKEVYSRGRRALCEAYVGTDTTGLAETFDTACSRIRDGLLRIAETAYSRGGGNVLAITSGMISMIYFFDHLGLTREDAPHGMPNTGVALLRFDGTHLVVEPPVGRTDLAE